ncbi:uncharacterized protein EAE98_001161 [Botrytis deweyae]|uniref:NWD NACHT-NTPase N-terminal domain-containing protein n=1 Tax=Botrytis deweyae TaxID=2478750 RepID=A0ABQ7J176_9HELO|nr:uncharacterized protein EAE98_001161 [Botrytis deweyae]KAF7938823.1 hypothetical protein EAE98_001161 [Botrytis deweyae]
MPLWFQRLKDKKKSRRSDSRDTLSSAASSLTKLSVQSSTGNENSRNSSITSSSTALPVTLQIEAERVQKDGSPRRFWHDAVQMLQENPSHRELLDTYQKILQAESEATPSSASAAPDYLLKTIDRSLKLLDEKRSKIRVGSATVEVRGALNKVAKAAQYAQSFVGSLVSGEPHAAMAWAGLSLFLPLLINAAEQPKALTKGVEYVSELLCRFSVTERLYQEQIRDALATVLTDTEELRSSFEKSLTELYAQVLLYQCRAISQLNSSKVIGIAKDMFKSENWDDLSSELKEYEAKCNRYKYVLDAEKTEREFRNFEKYMKGLNEIEISLQHQTKETLENFKHDQDLQANQRQVDLENACIQKFYVSAYEKQMNRNPDAVKDTCRWLLDNSNFQHWRDSELSSLLWVSAGPGCGKSVVSKMLIKALSKTSLPGRTRTICYFFFKEDDTLQRTAENALCAILHQILRTPGNSKLVRHAIPHCDKSGANIRESFAQMWEILMDIVQDEAAGEIICILDALDECEEKEGSGRYMLIEKFQKFHNDYIETTNSRNTCFKILVTSRPYFDIERKFKSLTKRYSEITLSGDEESAKISKEIDLVIEEKINMLRFQLELDNETTSALKEKLLSMEHRTYLWLRLIFEVLEQQLKTTKNYLLEVIEKLPGTVDDAYEAILNRIPKNEFERAKRLLSLVVVAERPLLVQEMNVALAIDENLTQDSQASALSLDLEPEAVFRAALGNICGLFVTVADSRVYLIHQTARSFLLSDGKTQTNTIEGPTFRWKNSVYPSEAHLLLSNICINYFLFYGLERDISVIQENWREIVNEDYWAKTMPERAYLIPEYSLIAYASGNWWKHLLHTNLEQGSPIQENAWMLCNTNYDYFLIWIMGVFSDDFAEDLNLLDSLEIAAVLGLDFVARRAFQSPTLSYRYSEALYHAVIMTHGDIVQTILEAVKINDLDRFLIAAIRVERRADVDTFGTIRLLVKHGAGNQDLRPALTTAAQEGLYHVVRFFVDDCGIDINSPLNYGLSILCLLHPSSEFEEQILSYLFERGVDPNGVPGNAITPLEAATNTCSLKMIRFLLEHGADVNLSGSSGWGSPLCQILQNSFYNSKVKEMDDSTYLLQLLDSSRERDCVIQMLLTAGAETGGWPENLSEALLQYNNRQKRREKLGICIDTGLDLKKVAESRVQLSLKKEACSGSVATV